MQHLTSLFDISPKQVAEILTIAKRLKAETISGQREAYLSNQVLLQIYEKPSLRTRVSFEAGMIQLGGSGMFMTEKEAGLHGRESLEDVARVASRFADVIVLRTFSQKLIEDFSNVSSCPVVNGLSDDFHPCQALTDLLTMEEKLGSLTGKTLVYLGDGNNVTASLAICCAALNVNFIHSSPKLYMMSQDISDQIAKRYPESSLSYVEDPHAAVKDADAVYTDVWASMGQEEESQIRQQILAPYQINNELLKNANTDAIFLHCLPAKRGQEVTDEIMDGPQSVVFDQAENRMHIAKAVFYWLLKGDGNAN